MHYLLLWGVAGLVSMLRAGEGKWKGSSSRCIWILHQLKMMDNKKIKDGPSLYVVSLFKKLYITEEVLELITLISQIERNNMILEK